MAKTATPASFADAYIAGLQAERASLVPDNLIDVDGLEEGARAAGIAETEYRRSDAFDLARRNRHGDEPDPEAIRLSGASNDAANAARDGRRRRDFARGRIAEIDRQLTANGRALALKEKCGEFAGQIASLQSERAQKHQRLAERRGRIQELTEQRKQTINGAIERDDAGSGNSLDVGIAIRDIDTALEVQRAGLTATESRIGTIANEITELRNEYDATVADYHRARFDEAVLTDEICYAADEQRRIDLAARSLRADRHIEARMEPHPDKVRLRARDFDAELPRPPVDLPTVATSDASEARTESAAQAAA